MVLYFILKIIISPPIIQTIFHGTDSMRLPAPVYNAVPNIYFVMGIVTWYFVIEAIVLDKGVGLVAFLSVSSLMMIANAFHIKHLRRRNKVAG